MRELLGWGRLFRGAAVYVCLTLLPCVTLTQLGSTFPDSMRMWSSWLYYLWVTSWHLRSLGQESFSLVCTVSKWWDSSERTQGPDFQKHVKSAKGQAQKERHSYNFVPMFEVGTVTRWAYSRLFSCDYTPWSAPTISSPSRGAVECPSVTKTALPCNSGFPICQVLRINAVATHLSHFLSPVEGGLWEFTVDQKAEWQWDVTEEQTSSEIPEIRQHTARAPSS